MYLELPCLTDGRRPPLTSRRTMCIAGPTPLPDDRISRVQQNMVEIIYHTLDEYFGEYLSKCSNFCVYCPRYPV